MRAMMGTLQTPRRPIPPQTDIPSADEPTPPAKTLPRRETPAGRWILELHQITRFTPHWFPLAVVEIQAADGGGYQVTTAEPATLLDDAAYQEAEVTSDTARLMFSFPRGSLTFNGRFADGQFIGNVLFTAGLCTAARLSATSGASSDDLKPRENVAASEFVDVVNSEPEGRTTRIREFISRHPDNAVVLDAYKRLAHFAKQDSLSAEDVQRLITENERAAERWGERRRQMVKLDVAMNLAGGRHLPELALELLADVERSLDEGTAAAWTPVIDSGRQSAKITLAQSHLESDDDATRLAAEQQVRELLGKDPYNSELLLTLARHIRKQGNAQEAIERFGTLAVTPCLDMLLQQQGLIEAPGGEFPIETVARLWEKKHGNTDGLDEYLNGLYDQLVGGLATDKVPPRGPGDGNRVALVELFTGAGCPPCVAADLATGVLESTYEHSEVIVIRYHKHVNGPDPMTTTDGEHRFSFYNVGGTPDIRINGDEFHGNPTGFLPHVKRAESQLRDQIDPILEQTTPVTIRPTAVLNEGNVQLSVNVEGVPTGTSSARLRLLLAEKHIEFLAPNGIRSHEMIVRWMPGGPDGVALDGAAGSYEEDVSLDEVRRQLNASLHAMERARGQRLFPFRPLSLDDLYLVAMVQDDETQQVFQSAVVPVRTQSPE